MRTGHRTRRVDFRLLAKALGRCRTKLGGGGRWKSQNRKNVYLSPYVEEPLNSKVIKSFVPELRSHYVFFEFRDPMYYVYIIIIIMSCRQHGYPWPSLATSPNHSSPPAGLLGYIMCPHQAAVCKFRLVVLLLLGHMWGSIGVMSISHIRIWLWYITSNHIILHTMLILGRNNFLYFIISPLS